MKGFSVPLLVLALAVIASCSNSSGADVSARRMLQLMTALVEDGQQSGDVVVRRIMRWDGPDYEPRGFSPDGRFMVFTRWFEDGNLYLKDMDRGQERQLTFDGRSWEEYASSSAFSNDGDRIAFSWYSDIAWETRLFTMSADGSDREEIALDGNWHPWTVIGWFPGDEALLVRVAPTEEEVREHALVSVPIDGSPPRMITRIPDPWVMRNYAFLSPDGRHALIRLEDPNGDTGVAASIVDTETGEIHTVLDTPGQERVFGWSTDGSHIFVANSVTGTPVLWAVPVADGQRSGDPILVRRNLHGLTVGKVIADRFYYWTLASDTRMLTVEIDVADGTVLREPSTEMAGLPERMEWSPDGKYAASYRSHVVTVQSFDGLHKQQFEIPREYRGEVSMMRWEPNSRSLTFRIRPDQVTLDLDTGTFSNDGTVSVYSSALMPDGETGYGVDSRGIFRTNRHSTERSFIVEAGSTDHPECFEGVLSRRISDTRRYVSVSSVTSLQEGPFCVGVLDTRTESFRWLFSVHSRPMPWAEAMVTPDDRRIMFKLATSSDDAEVWMISLEDVSPVPWKIFSYPGLRNATLHPNGRTLAFVGGKEYTEFWVMEGLDDVIAY